MAKTFSTDINGNTIIVREINTNKLKDLDSNYTGVKYRDVLVSPAVSKCKKLNKKKDLVKITDAEVSYLASKPLVPFLALVDPPTSAENTILGSPDLNSNIPSPASSDSNLLSFPKVKFGAPYEKKLRESDVKKFMENQVQEINTN